MTKKLKELRDSIEKQFGEGSVMLLGDKDIPTIDLIETGIFSLDKALGGGFPLGRMVEIYGPESTGKTTLALYIAAAAHAKGGNVAFIDAEHSLNLKLAKVLGVKTDELLLSQPDSAEQALEIVEAYARSGDVNVIIVDSVAALVPQAEVDAEMGESQMGLQARLMSKFCRKITPVLAKSNTLLVLLNQVRHKIGVFYGNPEVTAGGNAIKFYASQRLEVRRGEQYKEKEKIIGHGIVVKVAKNKIGTPFAKTELPLIYGNGIDVVLDLVEFAIKTGVIEKAGSWFSYGTVKLGQGKNAAVETISNDEKLLAEITKKVTAAEVILTDD